MEVTTTGIERQDAFSDETQTSRELEFAINPISFTEIRAMQPNLTDTFWTIPLQENVDTPDNKLQDLHNVVVMFRENPSLFLSLPERLDDQDSTVVQFDDQQIEIARALLQENFDGSWDQVFKTNDYTIETLFPWENGTFGTLYGLLLQAKRDYIQTCIAHHLEKRVDDTLSNKFHLEDLRSPLNIHATEATASGSHEVHESTQGFLYHVIKTNSSLNRVVLPETHDTTSFEQEINTYFIANPYRYFSRFFTQLHETLHTRFSEAAGINLLYQNNFFHTDTSFLRENDSLDPLFEGFSVRAEFVIGEYLQQFYTQAGKDSFSQAIQEYLSNRLSMDRDTPNRMGGLHYYEGEKSLRSVLKDFSDFSSFLERLSSANIEHLLTIERDNPLYAEILANPNNALEKAP